MALLDSKTVALIEFRLVKHSNESQSVTFKALGIADGHELDDEEKLQTAVDTIINAKGWEAKIDWLNCTVEFTKEFE